ncbi:MAG: AsmA-like C-terminal region-containing protein, partial [Hyphomicrobiaceae bacterium]
DSMASGQYRGSLGIDDDGALTMSGDLDVKATDTEKLAANLGFGTHASLAGQSNGTLHVEQKTGRLTFTSDHFMVAGTTTSGTLLFDQASPGAYRIMGNLKSAEASMPRLLAFLTSNSAANPSQGGTPSPSDQHASSPWSERPVDLSAIEGFTGSRIRLEVARLHLTPAAVVTNAHVEFRASRDSLDMRLMSGNALGGRANGIITLSKAPAGASLEAEGRLLGASLQNIAPDPGHPAFSGQFNLSLKSRGVALTPRGLIVAQTGSGTLALGNARLNRWQPAAIGKAAEAVLSVKGEVPQDLLGQKLTQALAGGPGIGLGSPSITIHVADGALRTQPLVIKTSGGSITARAMADIDNQNVDVQLRIKGIALKPVLPPLPPGLPRDLDLPRIPYNPNFPAVSVAFTGGMSNLGAIEPQMDYAALAREVTVRKVERDVIELERIRKIDEAMVRLEALRRQQQLQQPQPAPAAIPPFQQTTTPELQPQVNGQPNAAAPAPVPTTPARARTRRDPFEALRPQGGG